MEVLLTDVLVFGGAFNPPTNAHIELANQARMFLHYDKVIFVPSKLTYIKYEQRKDFAFQDAVRLEMLRKISRNREWMVVSDYEINQASQPRTYDTLCFLKQQGFQPRLLFGSDKLLELETGWKHVEDICHEFGIVCMERNNDDCKHIIENDSYLSTLKDYITIVHTTDSYQSLSSTKIRKLFLEKKYEEIEQYIPKELNGLKDYSLERDTL